MLIADIIKIKYVESGYLPNWPYHLISDEEMLRAFILNDINFFDDTYSVVSEDENVNDVYTELKSNIVYLTQRCIDENSLSSMPDWVYTYMLGEVVCEKSPMKDIDDLLTLSNLEDKVPAGTMNDNVYLSNIDVSKAWITKLPASKKEHRPVTLFGEPHVIKSLRLMQVDVTR